MRAFINESVKRDDHFRGLFSDDEYADVRTFFDRQTRLSPTPLRPLPHVARAARIRHVEAKDETGRFGLNAFKIVGVTYAAHKLGPEGVARGLVCATAGNHGRAVAHVACRLNVPCTIFVPAPARTLRPAEERTRRERLTAMRKDGAEVIEINGTYEEAVVLAAVHGQQTGATVLSDTSWDGYEEIPRWIMAGYTRIFEEASQQWESAPRVVVVQAGVGGLVCAAVSWLSWKFGAQRPFVVACEPDGAACLLESARAGRAGTVEGDLDTMMAGLRCAQPSPLAWPVIADGVDAFITISDQQALDAMEAITADTGGDRVLAGPSGICSAAALIALGSAPEFVHVRHAARLDRSAHALIVITEGA